MQRKYKVKIIATPRVLQGILIQVYVKEDPWTVERKKAEKYPPTMQKNVGGLV